MASGVFRVLTAAVAVAAAVALAPPAAADENHPPAKPTGATPAGVTNDEPGAVESGSAHEVDVTPVMAAEAGEASTTAPAMVTAETAAPASSLDKPEAMEGPLPLTRRSRAT